MTTHPLEPLSAEEVTAACAAVRTARQLGDTVRFPIVALHEPGKDELANGAPRRADVVVLDRADGALGEAVVDLHKGALVSWRDRPGAVPVLLFEEALEAIGVVQADPRWQKAVARRGVSDPGTLQIDPWPAGNFGVPEEKGRRLTRCLAYLRHHPQDNGYAHPLEGLVATVDLATGEVISVVDEGDPPVPIPQACANYGPGDVGALRTDLKPVSITQPEGPSFTLEGHELRWQRWRLRLSFHPVEGLVLHTVAYEDGGRLRPVLHRASVAEMVVPYGATAVGHWWKNAFDVGEWGLGRLTQSLHLHCDCLGEITYLDAVLSDESGGARVVERAICIHEEDYGILWKHVDLWGGMNEVRRSRRLVVSFISTVGNYEYGFYWYFYLDGTIELQVKLTGILQTAAFDPERHPPAHMTRVAPGLAAPHHQHMFCARLDLDIDGPGNEVHEIDLVPSPAGLVNPHGNGIDVRDTLLTSELAARRDADARVARTWRIVNPDKGTAYRLVPGASPLLLAAPEASVSRRAAFATHHLWVTPYSPEERRPAGDHPNQSEGGDGLPAWTAADRSLVGTDVVLWHTFGVSHLARPEDWPVMPVEYTGFTLRPDGFFERNPALDVPPAAHCD